MSAVGVLLVTVIVARSVDVDVAADIFLFMAAASGLSIFLRFGTDLHIIRTIGSRTPTSNVGEYFRLLFALLLIVSLAAVLLWFIYTTFVRQHALGTVSFYTYVPLMAIFTSVSHSCSSWLKALNKPALGSVFEASGYCIFLVPVLLITSDLTPVVFYAQSLLISLILGVAGVCLSIFYTRRIAQNGVLERSELTYCIQLFGLFRECLPLAVFALLSFVSQWGLLFLASALGDAELVSELNVMLRLLAPLLFVQLTLDSFLGPKLAAATRADEFKVLRTKGVLAMFAIALPVSFPFLFFPASMVTLLFGESYSVLAQYVPLMFVLMLLFNGLGSNIMTLAVQDSRVALMVFSLLRVFFVVIFAVIFIPAFGTYGGVLAYLMGVAAQMISARIWVDRKIRAMTIQESMASGVS